MKAVKPKPSIAKLLSRLAKQGFFKFKAFKWTLFKGFKTKFEFKILLSFKFKPNTKQSFTQPCLAI